MFGRNDPDQVDAAAPVGADEEQFRLLTGFNDIFVSIAIVLLLVASGRIGYSVGPLLGGALVAGVSWGLAEYFTRRRRMALPSILLLLSFMGGTGWTMSDLLGYRVGPTNHREAFASYPVHGIVLGGAVQVAAAWLHWRRFKVPIAIAVGAVTVAVNVVALAYRIVPQVDSHLAALLLVAGIAIFALAMRWDMSDRLRRTRRADVAFWLHLFAAPLIAHSLFWMLGVFKSGIDFGKAVLVLGLYAAFAWLALLVDRRAILVSGLAYALAALYMLLSAVGTTGTRASFAALVIGSALLVLSVFWHRMRTLVVGLSGGLGRYLPPAGTAS